MKFRAAILVESKKPLVVEEIESLPLRFGQVLVKIICSGVCGAQINEIQAVKGADKFLPHLLGHEATAVVVECGEGVASVQERGPGRLPLEKGRGDRRPNADVYIKTWGHKFRLGYHIQ